MGFVLDNELFITGRLKDLIIVRGINYAPHDLESVAEESHPAIRKGAAVAFSQELSDNVRIVVLCEIDRKYRDDAHNIVAAIRRAISDEFQLNLGVVSLLPVGSLHKTPSGKIQRRECRRAFEEDGYKAILDWQSVRAVTRKNTAATVADSSATAKDAISTWLEALLASLDASFEGISTDRDWTQSGLNSVDLIDVAAETNERFSIDVQIADLYAMKSMTEFID